jgi:hypothetical protein
MGANLNAEIVGEGEQSSKSNYFLGSDQSKWRTDVPTFDKLRRRSVYASIDQIFYGNQSRLEYYFIVAPGVDYRQIKMRFAGAKSVRIDNANGELVIKTARGAEVRQHRPRVYQEAGNQQIEIAARYVLAGEGARRVVSFEVGSYDPTLPLTIDPTLVYSTYLGGTSDEDCDDNEQTNLIAVDSNGNAYVLGTTYSPDFPLTPNAFQKTLAPGGTLFVTKLNSSGTGLIYSTFLAGQNQTKGYSAPSAIVLDQNNNAYVTGTTNDPTFPTTGGAFQTTFQQNAQFSTFCAFVTKLNASGSGLIYSTFLGVDDYNSALGIAVDPTGSAYVAGYTRSPNFPVTSNAFQTAFGTKRYIGFVTKLNAAGSALIYSTFLGGSGDDIIYGGIAVDAGGNAYLLGITRSTDFPVTSNALQNKAQGGDDVFLTILNAKGSGLLYSTYLGGTNADEGFGIAINARSEIYLTGITSSPNFPTKNPFQASFNGIFDAFITKFSVADIPIFSISGRIVDAGNNGLKNILVSLSGSQSASFRTDANGNYSFTDLPSGGSYTLTPTDAYLTFAPVSVPFSNLNASQQNVNFTASVAATPVPTPTPSDDFGGSGRDPARWKLGTITQAVTPSVSVGQVNGQLVITPAANQTGFNGYVATNSFDMTNAAASLEVVKVPNAGASAVFAVGSGADN